MAQAPPPAAVPDVGFPDLLRAFARIGVLSFGGPAAQIAVMHRELVEARAWLTERRFMNALAFCMLLPGPEAMQLATYCGWRLRGVPGGLAAGLLFVLPGAAVMLALAALYVAHGSAPAVEAVFLGIQAAVVVIVLHALSRMARKTLDSVDSWVVAISSFAAMFAFQTPFPLIVAAAAAYGWAKSRAPADPAPPAAGRRVLPGALAWAALWWAPVGAAWLAGNELLTQVGLFFSKLAVVTFGGAYAVLAYMAQEVVQGHGWLTAAQMMDGLGLAETTPGPLILVTEFVGFLAGAGAGGTGLAVAAAAMTLWVTFVPCFLWIFAGAPYIDWISTRPRLAGALRAIAAAVVGVILNLSLWFAAHVFFGAVEARGAGPATLLVPDVATLDARAAALALLAGAALFLARLGLIRTLLLAALAGALQGLF